MKRILKKSLSVFLSLLMVFSCFAMLTPEMFMTAEAATAGNYTVRITWQVNNTKNYSNQFTGTETEDGARAGIILYYKSNNGTGTESKVYWDIGWNNDNGKGAVHGTYVSANKSTGYTNSSTGKDYYCVATIAGFPTALYGMADSDNFTDKGQYTVSKIEVYNNTTSSYNTLWAGKGYTDTSTEKKWWKITADGDGTVTTTGNDSSYGYASTTTETWNFPTPTTATTWSGVSDMTCPKTGTATQNVKVIANDQYGVQLFTPTWSVKGNVCGNTGISVSPATADETTISLTNAANVASSTDTQTGTITATWGTLGSMSETFTITDSYYTATFNYKTVAGADTSATRNGYHGDTITAPSAPEYDSGDYHYKFSAWSPAFVSTITADVTYNANYTSTFVGADYTAVNEAIAAANAVKAQYGNEYELKYTLASRVALDSAINAVVTGLGRTQQSVVDGYAQAINDAIAALDPNKFDVIFLDNNGAIILYEKNAEYKESVTAPAFPEDQKTYYDSTNHYTYIGWDTDEYTSVVDDLVITPVYTAEAHVFTTSTVPSTCVTKGATKYTCACGYSYVDGETDYGDHVWETEYTTDLEPTCTVAGSKSIHCSLCDAQKDVTAIDPLGHNFTSQSIAVDATCGKIGIATRVCDDCGFCEHTVIPALEHDYKETVVAPTCTAKGYTEYVCQRANCGHSYRDSYTDVIDHNYGGWEIVYEKSCEVQGLKKRTCQACGFIELQSIAADAHDDLGAIDWEVIIEPTCEADGYRTKTCSKCEAVLAKEVMPALNHIEVVEEVQATCTQAGYKKVSCSRCDDVETTIYQALGHDWDNGTHTGATCTNGGFTVYTCQRTDCGETKIVHDENSTGTGHSFTVDVEVITPATCEDNGEKKVKCANCDATTTVVIPRLGHAYGEWVTVTAPTCTEDGEQKKTCSNDGCNSEITAVMNKLGHKWGEWSITKAATNTEDGEMTRYCLTCNEPETVAIPKGGHVWDNGTVTLEPTCTTEGKMVYACTAHTDCGVTLETTLDVVPHTIVTEIKQAKCDEEGYIKTYCSVCDKVFSNEPTQMIAHVYTAGTVHEPTCTTSGYTVYTCVCGDTYNMYDASKPATGHNYKELANSSTATCEAAGKKTLKCEDCTSAIYVDVPALGHDFGAWTEATKATCEADGTRTRVCSRCSETETEIIAKLGHVWGEWSITKAATNTEDGKMERVCEKGCKEEITIPKGGHVWDNGTVTLEPTCTTEGKMVYACTAHTDCGVTLETTVALAQHTPKTVEVAATCTSEGSVTTYCSVCNKVLGSAITTDKIAHVYTAGAVHEPTCTTSGYTVYACACGDTYNKYDESKPANGHSFKLDAESSTANCETAGTQVHECEVCGETVTVNVPALGHDYGLVSTTTATCAAAATETYKCSRCTASYTISVGNKTTDHTWGEWKVVEKPTDTSLGYQTRECSVCGKLEVETLSATGEHVFTVEKSRTPATCTADGEVVYGCATHTDCGLTSTVVLKATGHSEELAYTAPTCTTEGSTKMVCSVCDATIGEEKTIPVTTHNYDSGVITTPATCTTEGVKTFTCSVCDGTRTEPVSKTGHSFTTTVNDSTCTQEGSVVTECALCGDTETKTIAKKNHSFTGTETVVTAATCEKDGEKTVKCAACDATTTVIIPKLGHEWGEWVIVQPTNTTEGSISRTCVKGCTESVAIPKGEHKMALDSKEEATCTKEGKLVYKCEDENCNVTLEITLDKIQHVLTTTEKAATCEEAGEVVTKCENCSTVNIVTTIPAIGHAWAEEKVTPSTCSEKGKIEYSCSRADCDGTKVVELELNPNAHAYTTTVEDSTCTQEGSVVTKCGLCGDTETKIIAKKNHSFTGTETVVTEATCEKDGEKTVKCATCDATTTVIIPKLGHEWGEWVIVQPTNTTEGSISRTCVKGCTESVAIPKGEHKMALDSEEEATCTKEGKLVYKCEDENCDVTLEITLDKIQHVLTTTEKAATCEEAGEVVTKCENCSTVNITTVIPATKHAWNEGVVTTPATCTAEGVMTFTCQHNAAHTYTKAIAKLQHNYVAGTAQAPTCTTSGYTPYTCDGCNDVYNVYDESKPANGHSFKLDAESSTANCETAGTQVHKCEACDETVTVNVPALGHDYELVSTTTATCAAAATETYKCSRCDASYTISVGEKTTNHSFGAWTVVEKPTDTSLGYQTRECSVCGKLEVVTLSATGEHVFTKEISRVEPSCTKDGEVVYGCATHEDCGLTSTVVLKATGHSEELAYTAPTCTAPGSTKMVCSVCDVTIGEVKIIPVTTHNYDSGVITTPATCTTEGVKTFTCADCGVTRTEPVSKTGHDLTTEVLDATCEAPGAVVTTCKNGCSYNEVVPIPATGHTISVIVTQATCESDGSVVEDCDNCDYENTTVLKAYGHEFTGASVVTKEATCEADGVKVTKCSRCDETQTSVVAKLGHNYVAGEAQAPTCTTSGYTPYVCQNDNSHTYNVYDESKPANGHSFKLDAESSTAGCETEGTQDHKCEVCGETVTVNVPALGHDYELVSTTTATCGAAATETYKCSRCDASYTISVGEKTNAHTWGEWKVVEKATEKSLGYQTRECSVCGKLEVKTIPATGEHVFTKEISRVEPSCTKDGEVIYGCATHEDCGLTSKVVLEATGHSEELAYTAPTCTTEGSTKMVCSVCDATIGEEKIIPVTTHNYDSGVITTPATCTKEGVKTFTCADCGGTRTEPVSKTGHDLVTVVTKTTCEGDGSVVTTCKNGCGYNETNVFLAKGHAITVTIKKATCEDAGSVIEECQHCDYEKTTVIEALKHDFNGDESVIKEATCEAYGEKEVGCTRCDETTTVVIPKLGHDYVVDKEVEATCTTSGYTVYVCQNDGSHTYNEYNPAKPAKGHSYTEVENTATCEAAGKKTLRCACGDEIIVDVNALGHDYKLDSTTTATCGAAATETYKCSRCDASYTISVGEKTNAHTWGEWKVVEKATEKSLGYQTRECSVCGKLEVKTIPATGEHVFTKEISRVEPSCTKDGEVIYGCATHEDCGLTSKVVLEATGHSEELVCVVPTCTAAGVAKMVCTVCNEVLSEKDLPIAAHKYGEGVITVAATCTGLGTMVYTCTACGNEKIETINPIGHSLVKRTLDPTCAKDGYNEVDCTRADCDYLVREIIPATGNHDMPDDWTVIEDATCVKNGLKVKECKDCLQNDQYEIIPATGVHSFKDNWKVVYEAKCDVAGLEEDICTTCKLAKQTREIPALEHIWETVTTDPTCETDGSIVTTCKRDGCGSTTIEVIGKLGHDYVQTGSTIGDCDTGSTITFTCRNDNNHTYTVTAEVAEGHDFTATVTQQASCTQEELTTYRCHCGVEYVVMTAGKEDHDWGEWKVVTAATETTAGLQRRQCTVCNVAYETAPIPATGVHKMEKGEYSAPTCTTSGYQVYVCTTHTDCTAGYTVTINPTGHDVVFETTDATCTSTGLVKAYCQTSGCGTEIGSYEVPMLDHRFTETVSTKDATCTEDGEKVLKCAHDGCDETTTVVLPKTGHSYTSEVTQKKDCTKAEITTYTCHCGHSYTEITAVPMGHNWGDWMESKAPTADKPGELVRNCNRTGCDASETAPVEPTGEHTIVVDSSKEATCTEAGWVVYKCTEDHGCKVEFTHNIPAKRHDLELQYKAATCTEDGYSNIFCKECNTYLEANTIKKLNHNYKGEITTPAGCGTEGVITYTCQNDASHTYTEKIPALKHDYSVEVAGSRVEPTCVADGSVTMKCINCDSTQVKVLSKTGHLFDEGVVIEQGDCVTAGKIEYTCKYDHTHKFTEVTQPTGAHDFGDNKEVVYEATCTTGEKVTRYCDYCKNHVVIREGEPLGHNWSEWTIVKKPTADEYGVQARKCMACDEMETMTLTPGRTFKITFYDFEGVRITKPTVYNYGSAVVRPEIPIRVEDAVFTYEFLGWRYDSCTLEETAKMLDYLGYGWDYSKVEGEEGYEAQEGIQKEMAFVAEYKKTEQVYTVNYCDDNGKILHTMENVLYSDVRTAWNVIPTKESSEQYNYTFSQWSVKYDTDEVTGENIATATAEFTKTQRPDYEGPSEPTLFDKIIQRIRDFFNKILAFLGLGG